MPETPPRSQHRTRHRIESLDYSALRVWHTRPAAVAGLVNEASVDLDEHLSMHPALRADHMTDGKSRPLSSTGEAEFTGCGRLPKDLCLSPFTQRIDAGLPSNAVDINSQP